LKTFVYFLLLTGLILSCNNNKGFKVLNDEIIKETNNSKQFSLVPSSKTSIQFQNKFHETQDLNFLNFSNIYNGGGVVTADFNNDNLVDVFFVANQESNKLYLNKGQFKFEDITRNSGIEDLGGWSTGASAIDVNNDGWLDLYVCKSGSLTNSQPRENKLYINQKNNTFKESAKQWKVNDDGFSTQSYFFDFDKDGDLDMYLVNHRVDFENTSRLNMEIERTFTKQTSDKLYRNDGGFFTDITRKSGVVNNAWGLSASIGDFNNDGWPDVYVCNDFLTPDMLYINNKNGTFTNEILDRMNHISFSSMGSDFADINNDLLPDLLVLEMASEDHVRSKQNMATMNTKSFNNLVKMKYHHQYMVNTLQSNNGNGQFSEIAQMSGIAKTDWSWSPLIADFDNDGFKDVFITNGILKEMGNQDFRTKLKETYVDRDKPDFQAIIDMMPSNKIANYSFKNNGDFTFVNTSTAWGFDAKTQSNGVAYADFDNDGDLDLAINNIDGDAQIYQNNDLNNFIQLRLEGDQKNTSALGTKVSVTVNGKKQYQELYTSRGFLSSVQNIMNFGIGDATLVDEILIEWPNEQATTLLNVEANQIIKVDQKHSVPRDIAKEVSTTSYTAIKPTKKGIKYKHQENEFDDYKNQILLPHSQSTNGPFIDNADVNNDGLNDFFVGGAIGQSGELYIQTNDGSYTKQKSLTWEDDKNYEDLGVLFFDVDSDNDQDLYVVSGGSEFEAKSAFYQDRIYLNDGNGNFSKSNNALPEINSSGQTVKASDIDNDGDLDLFVGGRIIPDKYPYAPKSYILINENGKFQDKTDSVAPSISNVGMVTDAVFTDYDNDGDDDLMLVGEWMSIRLFENVNGTLQPKQNKALEHTEGLWFSIEANDIDNDGDTDYFVGNLGLNTKFKASKEKPFHVFCDDFDNSGTYDIVLTSNYKGTLVPSRGKECSTQQMPFIKDKFPSFQEFANASLADIYGEDELDKALHYEVVMLESIFIENLGNGEFEIRKLPRATQIAPIMDFEIVDVDGLKDIVITGNHYNPEVETVRYDASYGFVLSYENGVFEVKDPSETGFVNKGNAKQISVINSKDEKHLLVTNNDGELNMFVIKNTEETSSLE